MKFDNIKAIFFDADNTIIDHKECEKQALVNVFMGIGVEYKEEYQSIFRPLDRGLWDSVTQGINPVPKEEIAVYRFKVLFEKIGISYEDCEKANELFTEGLANSTALMEHAEEIIQYLHEKNYKLYVVTNGRLKLQRPRVMNSKIGEYISDIIVSEEVGVDKPNPEIFHTLLRKANLKPEEVIMVGDSLDKDIKGAQNAGIASIWYNPEGDVNAIDIVPDYEISNLLELKKIVLKT